MRKTITKDKADRVVKPLKKLVSDVISKKASAKEPFKSLSVIDSDGNVVATFREAEYGPRFVFKATQYAANHSTLDNPLTVQ